MSTIPEELRYTREHEWVRVDGDVATVGITDFAQSQLGEIIYVELPPVGRAVAARAVIAVVESVKAASDVYAPVGGEVIESNAKLIEEPGGLNRSPYGDGWLVKLRVANPAEAEALLAPDAYAAIAKE